MKAMLNTLAKVAALTILLYGLLYWPEFGTGVGLTSTWSPVLEYVEVAGSPHGMVVLSWWKVGVVALLVVAYAVSVVAWVRRRYRPYPEMVASAVVLLVGGLLMALFVWPDVSFALADRNQVSPSGLQRHVLQFDLGFPGGPLGYSLAFAALQVLLTIGVLRVVRGDHRALQ